MSGSDDVLNIFHRVAVAHTERMAREKRERWPQESLENWVRARLTATDAQPKPNAAPWPKDPRSA